MYEPDSSVTSFSTAWAGLNDCGFPIQARHFRKIYAVFQPVGMPFPFVPFVLYRHIVYTI